MVIFKKSEPVRLFLEEQKATGARIGFVPTMGALHEGHLSLISQSALENSLTVCSIFVNPTQFNNPDDFRLYPVTVEADIERLTGVNCPVLFLPTVPEVYPSGYVKPSYDLGPIESVLEGHYRPGHFQGVCEVVDRLLSIVQPDTLYLGQKDYQQCMVVRRLLELTGRDDQVALSIAPTLREADGLAMSSRNLRLEPPARAKAPRIYQMLQHLKSRVGSEPLDTLEADGRRMLESEGFAVDYVAIADAATLAPPAGANGKLVGLVAASIQQVRLIDNLPLN
ncbi:MAG TPA: pantoate--beta-alanine ligase [Chitinophagaceae bacterium]|jgi:pantoate--beta-alanine ligase|nr:pantoate--beta-alanine ligase [Chitinophagaceae bacterium]